MYQFWSLHEITFILKMLTMFSSVHPSLKAGKLCHDVHCSTCHPGRQLQAAIRKPEKTSPTVFQKGFSGLISNLIFKFLHKKGRLNNCSPAAQIRSTDLNVKTLKKMFTLHYSWDLAEWLESACLPMPKLWQSWGSIPASSDTVESEGQTMQCWIQYTEEKIQKFPRLPNTTVPI
jgi:hypothetical protein